MKTIIATEEERVERLYALLCQTLREKPGAVIALSAAEDCLPAYRKLSQGAVSLRGARFFAVGEFEDLPAEDARSCRSRLLAALEGTDAAEENFVWLTAENMESYDSLIAAAGGLDLAILGLGINARIGFNEPATPYDSRSHRQKLAPATRRELTALFGAEEQVPAYGLTMGVKTLVEARKIAVTAAGEAKAKAAFDMLYGRDDSTVPAAFLQLPPEVTAILDESAARKL